MARQIALTRGYVAVVDDEDFDRVSRFRWHAVPHQRSDGTELVYAKREGRKGEPRKNVFMHHEVLGSFDRHDHRDGNGLNNQKDNLRPASYNENNCNTRKRGGTSSRFRGVSLFSAHRWSASIQFGTHRKWLGLYDSEESAALAYDREARKLHGEFARLNFPDAESFDPLGVGVF